MSLPLFPLNTVLFPGCRLDLQIFEARYLDMVSACMKRGEGFTVQSSRVQPDQLLLAEVQWLDEGEDRPLLAEHVDLAALLLALAEHPMVAALGMVEGQQALAHQLAYLLPLSQEQKLELLEEADAAQRLARIQTFLSALQGELIA